MPDPTNYAADLCKTVPALIYGGSTEDARKTDTIRNRSHKIDTNDGKIKGNEGYFLRSPRI